MTFAKCLSEKAASDESKINKKQAKEFIEIYDKLKQRTAIDESLNELSEQDLAERAVEIVEANKNKQKYKEMRQIKSFEEARDDMESYRDQEINEIWEPYGASIGGVGKRLKVGEGALGLLSTDLGKRATYSSMEEIQKGLQAQYYGRITEVMEEFKKSSTDDAEVMGRRLLRAILDGDDVDPSTNAMAGAIREVFDTMAEDYRLAGGSLRMMDDYFPNPDHDPADILGAGREKWKKTVKPLLDWENIADKKTGIPITDPQEQDEFLDRIWNSITRESDPRDDLGTRKSRTLSNQRSDERTLHFKSADSWMKYNEEFGASGPVNSIVKYVDKMSRDIAMMKRLGPNPKKSKRMIEDLITRKGDELRESTDGLSQQLADKEINRFDTLYKEIMGSERGLTNSDFDKYVNDLNNLTVSATIGSAFLKALPSDTGFTGLTAFFNGMPATRAMSGIFKTFLDTAKGGERIKLAQEAQAVANAYKSRAIAQARYFNDIDGHGFTNMLADKTLKWSGMTPWTVAARSSWGLETTKFFNKLKDTKWEDLQNETGSILDAVLGRDDVFRESLRRYGFTKKDWEILRQASSYKDENTGLELLRPADIQTRETANRTGLNMEQLRQVKEKYQRFILGEQQFAVPSVTHRARATLGGEDKLSNPWARAIYKSFKMYKNFPITVWQTHVHRMLQQQNNLDKLGYGAMLFATTTLAGGIGMQMQELAKGRTPIDMGFRDDGLDMSKATSFWGNAMIEGGGLGIFGDSLFRNAANPRKSIMDAVAGPPIGAVNDAIQFTFGNAMQAADPEQKMELGADAVDFARRWTPMGNIWQTRLLMERGMMDKFQKAVDPNYHQDIRRYERKLREESGQEYWAHPREGLSGIVE